MMLRFWLRTLRAHPPYVLHWHSGGEAHCRIYAGLLDALLASRTVLDAGDVAAMSLTDRDDTPLPFLAHATLTWRWGSEVTSEVLSSGAAVARRLNAVAVNGAVEFVSLVRPDGHPLLTPARFERLRARCSPRSTRRPRNPFPER